MSREEKRRAGEMGNREEYECEIKHIACRGSKKGQTPENMGRSNLKSLKATGSHTIKNLGQVSMLTDFLLATTGHVT